MQYPEDNKLDNPVWHSLSETHCKFSVDYDNIKFYLPDYCLFGGFRLSQNNIDPINNYSQHAENFYLVGEQPVLPKNLNIKKDLVCLQMVAESKIEGAPKDQITKLSIEDASKVFQLVNTVQPGYFRSKTFFLGDYWGIFEDGKLIAVTGERMKMDRFTELSAIVTHPNHTGKGYAKQLIAHTVNNIFDQNKTPFLHVVDTNIGAITLYEKLGFKTRRKISFWNVTTDYAGI